MRHIHGMLRMCLMRPTQLRSAQHFPDLSSMVRRFGSFVHRSVRSDYMPNLVLRPPLNATLLTFLPLPRLPPLPSSVRSLRSHVSTILGRFASFIGNHMGSQWERSGCGTLVLKLFSKNSVGPELDLNILGRSLGLTEWDWRGPNM